MIPKRHVKRADLLFLLSPTHHFPLSGTAVASSSIRRDAADWLCFDWWREVTTILPPEKMLSLHRFCYQNDSVVTLS